MGGRKARRRRSGSLAQDGGHDEGGSGQGEEDTADQPAENLCLRHHRGFQAFLLLGNLQQRFLKFTQRAELFLDVPELGQSLLDVIGAPDQLGMAALQFGLDGDEGLKQGLDDSGFDRLGLTGIVRC